MRTGVTAYDVLISCASDVSEYVTAMESVFTNFNSNFGRRNNIALCPVNWKNNSFSQQGAQPQAIINDQLVREADICVAIFWTRFGTKTEEYGSGTEEEIERMKNSGKQVFIYFLDKPIVPSQIDDDQYKQLKEFKEKVKFNGVYTDVKDETALINTFRNQLELYFTKLIQGKIYNSNIREKLILWVDDRPENCAFERNILEEQYGLKFDLALSTERALKLLETNNYNLIISDMGRKEGLREGYELLQKIRAMDNIIPFLIFSSDGSLPKHRDEARKRGAQGSTNSSVELVAMTVKILLHT